MHMTYFHHVVDYGTDNEWITNLHFVEISKSIEAEDWETVSAWWVSYLGKRKVLA